MKPVTITLCVISFFCSLFIGTNNGKVESYFAELLVDGQIVEYQQYVDEEEQYDGRKTIPAHYEDAYRFEPVDKENWLLKFIKYMSYFICLAIPFINFKIFAFASEKVDKMKVDDEYKRRRKALIASSLNK